ncbi:hypothetical protein [Streptomyces sp. KMM 9044]|uniref:hypothetical protein n=1 Tax=Streptomyces sp. KMM 9044 TaxID=2744474 RepID=UPI0021513B5D|nr:hypothetical protein [Streptomyces sp. KMM 9044]WAX81909.1 hypothetical protein HUV60_016215 [Streptomyces sp. KMM 9044]
MGVALVALIGMAGCGGTTSSEHGGPEGPEGPEGPKGRLRGLTAAEEILVERAENLLVKKCVEKAGFRFWVAEPESLASRKGSGFVLDDVGWAKKYGYGGQFGRNAEEARSGGPNATYVNALPDKERAHYRAVLDGTPSSGMLSVELPGGGTVRTPRDSCQSRAKDQLYGDFATWFRVEKIATNLTPLYVPDLAEDKRFTKALAAWSLCMEEKGRNYSDPFEIRTEVDRRTEGLSDAAAHAVEVEFAVDEAECAKDASLAETARALESEYRAKEARRYREEIAVFQRMRLTALERAKAIAGV